MCPVVGRLAGGEASADAPSQLGTERKSWRGSFPPQDRRAGRQAPDAVEPGAPDWPQESLRVGPAAQATSTCDIVDSPNVIIEEIIEEAEPGKPCPLHPDVLASTVLWRPSQVLRPNRMVSMMLCSRTGVSKGGSMIVLIDDVTAHSSSTSNSEMFRSTVEPQRSKT